MSGTRTADLPDLGSVTDTSIVVGDNGGTGTFRATALRAYINTGLATETAARIAADTAEAAARTALGATVTAMRIPINANTIWYVDGVLGNDANDGLTPGAGAFLTIQRAINVLAGQYDGRGFSGTISVATGTYNLGSAGLVISTPWVGFSSVTLLAPNTPQSVNIQCTVSPLMVLYDVTVYLSGGWWFNTATAGFSDIQAIWGGQIFVLAGPTFGPTPGAAQIYASRNGYIEIDGNVTMYPGTSGNLMEAEHGGEIRMTSGAQIIWSGNHNYSDCTLYAFSARITITGGAAFNQAGFTISGQQYRAANPGGMIEWAVDNGAGIPGNLIGTEVFGGRYAFTGSPVEWTTGVFQINMAVIGSGLATILTNFVPGLVEFDYAVAGATGVVGGSGTCSINTNGGPPQIATNFSLAGGAAGPQPANNLCFQYYTAPGVGIQGLLNTILYNGLTFAFVTLGAPTGTVTIYWRAKRGL